MLYHIKINQHTEYDVEATSTQEAITIALDTYYTDDADVPDTCLRDDTTHNLCICAEYVGDVVQAPPVP